MKESVLLLALLMSSTVCFNFEDDSLKSCAARVVETLFGNDVVLTFVFWGEEHDALPYNVVNPKIIHNVSNLNGPIDKWGKKIFVAQWDKNSNIVKNLPFLDRRKDLTAKMLFIGKNISLLKRLFSYLWKFSAIYTAVLLYDKSEDEHPVLYTSDPHAVGNDCRGTPNIFTIQSCVNSRLEDTLPKPFKNYNRCPLRVVNSSIGYSALSMSTNITLEALRRLNFSTIFEKNVTDYNYLKDDVIPMTTTFLTARPNEYSKPFHGGTFVFIVPQPSKIVGPELLIMTFSVKLWIMVTITFVGFIIAWCLILYCKSEKIDGAAILLKTFSLTLFGSVNTMPRRVMLSLLILLYIIYAIHIQTAFVSKLLSLLTTPQYEKGIKNVEDLANSNYTIYVGDEHMRYFNENCLSNSTYQRFKTKIKEFSFWYDDDQFKFLMKQMMYHNNFSIFIPTTILREFQTHYNYTYPNVIEDDFFVISYEVVFMKGVNHYLLYLMNTFIDRLTMSGFYQKVEMEFVEHHKRSWRSRQQSDEPVVITLSHVYGIFIIYGIGILAATVTFFAELYIFRCNSRRV